MQTLLLNIEENLGNAVTAKNSFLARNTNLSYVEGKLKVNNHIASSVESLTGTDLHLQMQSPNKKKLEKNNE